MEAPGQYRKGETEEFTRVGEEGRKEQTGYHLRTLTRGSGKSTTMEHMQI